MSHLLTSGKYGGFRLTTVVRLSEVLELVLMCQEKLPTARAIIHLHQPIYVCKTVREESFLVVEDLTARTGEVAGVCGRITLHYCGGVNSVVVVL